MCSDHLAAWHHATPFCHGWVSFSLCNICSEPIWCLTQSGRVNSNMSEWVNGGGLRLPYRVLEWTILMWKRRKIRRGTEQLSLKHRLESMTFPWDVPQTIPWDFPHTKTFWWIKSKRGRGFPPKSNVPIFFTFTKSTIHVFPSFHDICYNWYSKKT